MSTTPSLRGRAATRPGPAGLAVAAALVVGAAAAAVPLWHAAHRPAAAGLRGYPAFLPKDTLGGGAAHRVVDATAASPVLASQGDTVRVHTSRGVVLATVSGPAVPVQGQATQSPVSPATWTVRLQGESGSVPLELGRFAPIDDQGEPYRLASPPGEAPPPRAVGAGQTVAFRVTTVMKTGEGVLRWTPEGTRAPVEWDFTVEND